MKIKTNAKMFKEKVQQHIIEILSTDETEVLTEQLQHVIDDFKNWYSPYEQKMTPNLQDAFIDWLHGLPSSIHIEYTWNGIYTTMKRWWESCGAEYVEQRPEKEADLYYRLVYREFNVLCKQNGIKGVNGL